jgi:hypothetical protein
MPTQKLTPEIINAAILGFEEQKRHIDTQIAELRAMLDGGTKTAPATEPEAPGARSGLAFRRRVHRVTRSFSGRNIARAGGEFRDISRHSNRYRGPAS